MCAAPHQPCLVSCVCPHSFCIVTAIHRARTSARVLSQRFGSASGACLFRNTFLEQRFSGVSFWYQNILYRVFRYSCLTSYVFLSRGPFLPSVPIRFRPVPHVPLACHGRLVFPRGSVRVWPRSRSRRPLEAERLARTMAAAETA